MTKRQLQQESGDDRCATVLVVDDEPMVLRVCRRVLERDGHRVLTAQGAERALEAMYASDCCIDVLLCDVVMPQVCGGELAIELRALEPNLQVIFFSGYIGDAESRCQIESGRARFLSKPFVADELLRLVDEVLASASA